MPSLKRMAATRPDSPWISISVCFSQQEFEALVFERLLQHLAGDCVELALEQPRAEVHDGHVHAAQLEAIGGFQPEQAAADDHRVLVQPGGFDHLVGVLDVAVADDAGQVVAGNRQHEGVEPVAISRRS